MKTPHAKWVTLHKGDIDQHASIEIIWKTEPNTLNLLIFRIGHGGTTIRPRLTTEEIGPYHSVAELHQQLCTRFGELAARHVCQHSSSWLPPGYDESLGHDKPQPREKSATERLPAFGGQTAHVADVNRRTTRGRESLPATINCSMIQMPRDPLPS